MSEQEAELLARWGDDTVKAKLSAPPLGWIRSLKKQAAAIRLDPDEGKIADLTCEFFEYLELLEARLLIVEAFIGRAERRLANPLESQ